ncbi:MAG: hypothetical protein MK132_00745, partial [Lentisphaerales bacterium]|nr:hypothetical protein [Lentisphaerales bacterium]
MSYKSNDASNKKDILGTLLLSALPGHKRYTHMNVISGDEASVEILDLNEVCSEDSIYVASTNRKKLSLPRQLKISNQHFFL